MPPQHLMQPRESRFGTAERSMASHPAAAARPPHLAPSALGVRDYSREPEPAAPRSTWSWRPPTPPKPRATPPAAAAVQYDWPAEAHNSARRTSFAAQFTRHEDERYPAGEPSRQPAAMPPAIPSQAIGQQSFGQAAQGVPPADVWTRDEPQREEQREHNRRRELEEKYEAARRNEFQTRSQQLLRQDPNAFDHSLRGFYMNRHKGTEAAALLTMNPW